MSRSGEYERDRKCFEGEIFSEIVEINGEKYEHIGFRDREGKFGEFISENRGRRARICVEVENGD